MVRRITGFVLLIAGLAAAGASSAAPARAPAAAPASSSAAAATGPAPAAARAPAPAPAAAVTGPREATVSVDARTVVNRFRPDRALGAGLDGHGAGETAQIYAPANVRAMASAGLGPLTYRLRTELGVEDWHWNPVGRFSAGSHGYWTSSTSTTRPFRASYGYRLPRRGDTVDQANDDGFSRLDDGSTASFWKSNPYLDPHFTHESHPQWALIDLGWRKPVDGLRIDWAAPYATRLAVQHWVGPSAIALSGHPPGYWTDFPRATFAGRPGPGGLQTLRLAATPMAARFVRILLLASSHTAPAGSRDIRDRLGYAIRELGLGRLDRRGHLVDLIRHRAGSGQTITMVSSTDPWHAAANRDPQTEQPSFTTVLASGLTRHQPVLVPVGVLYGTPANAVAELRYLRALHVPLRGVELGEEPDGQLASPEDYGALYLEFARAIHRAFPGLPLGGPGYQTSIPDWYAWPDPRGNRSWTSRFVGYLRVHRALGELSFFSFEWYPFDNTCAATGPQLARSSSTLASVLAAQAADGLPPGIPRVITEYGYSAFAGRAEVDLPGALLNADVVGQFLTQGGATAYLYGYEPDALMAEPGACKSYGNLTLLVSGDSHRIRQPAATYWAARLLTRVWTTPGDGLHLVLATTARFADGGDPQLLGAYAVRQPSGRIGVLLLNKDPTRTVRVRLGLAGPLERYTFGPAEYVWHARGAAGYARPDGPPVSTAVSPGAPVDLPPDSLAVLLTA